MEFNRTKFSQDLKAKRGDLSLREVGLVTGVPISTLSRLEGRHTNPDLINLIILCRWMGRAITDYVCEYDIVEPEVKKRYFIVFFIGNKDGLTDQGSLYTVVDDGYLNNNTVCNFLMETYSDVSITNFIELTEQDYNDFTKY